MNRIIPICAAVLIAFAASSAIAGDVHIPLLKSTETGIAIDDGGWPVKEGLFAGGGAAILAGLQAWFKKKKTAADGSQPATLGKPNVISLAGVNLSDGAIAAISSILTKYGSQLMAYLAKYIPDKFEPEGLDVTLRMPGEKAYTVKIDLNDKVPPTPAPQPAP